MRSQILRLFSALLVILAPLVTPLLGAQEGVDADRMEWWRDARFGLFLHWGLYSVPAGEWNGATNYGEWLQDSARIPVDEYEGLLQKFDPAGFDAGEWASLAKQAGMNYVVITTKHHDGFALFDSKVSEYDVMATPFRRDVMRELADACRKEGLRIGWYHSILDWHHPDFLPRRPWEKRPSQGADFERYVTYLRAQVEELLTRYGEIAVMWFDGEWESTWTPEMGAELYELCRRLQPRVIVNNRVDKGRSGMAGMTSDAGYKGDFGTPEQEVPRGPLPGVDWESCVTMSAHWGYNRADQKWKSHQELIRLLIEVASKGGNLLLNVGPTGAGTFPPQAVERLERIGAWMAVNAESIHGTEAGPFEALPWGFCTMKELGPTTRLYLHVFDWPADGALVVPGIGNEIHRAKLLAEPELGLATRREESDIVIELPPDAPDAVASVVVLDVEGPPVIYRPPTIVSPAQILVRPLQVELICSSEELEVRYTLDGSAPVELSPLYQGPLELRETTVLKARAFHKGKPVSGVSEATFRKVQPTSAQEVEPVEPGLSCEVYSGKWNSLPDYGLLQPISRRIAPTIGLQPGTSEEFSARRFTGYFTVPHDDVYLFSLASDDGSRLWIGDRLLIDNDGLHSLLERTGVMALSEGMHPLRIEFFNKEGGAELDLRVAPLGEKLRPLPETALFHEPGRN